MKATQIKNKLSKTKPEYQNIHQTQQFGYSPIINIDKSIAQGDKRFMEQPVDVAIDDYFDYQNEEPLDPATQLKILNIYQEKEIESWAKKGLKRGKPVGDTWNTNLKPSKVFDPTLRVKEIFVPPATAARIKSRENLVKRKKGLKMCPTIKKKIIQSSMM